MTGRSLERTLEWEPFSEQVTLEYVGFPTPPFYSGTSKVRIRRDNEMCLEVVAEGRLTQPAEVRERRAAEHQIPEGTFVSPSEIELGSAGDRWTIRAHFDAGFSFSSSTVRGELTTFTQQLCPIEVRRISNQRVDLGDETRSAGFVALGPAAWRSDWYINGPQSPVFFRKAARRRTAVFARDRGFGSIRVSEAPTGHHSNADHLIVETDAVWFAVTKVPDEFAPPWCRPISIEFRDPIPSEDIREAVGEIVSFVLGRRLMPVGSTVFDSTGWSIEEYAENPWGHGIVRLCEGPDVAPVPLADISQDAEIVLAALVPRYLATRSTLALDDALFTYWQANEAIAGVDLPLYASALESLKNRWFKSVKSKSKGAHITKEKYETLLGDLLRQMRERLQAEGLPPAIANRISRANEMGGGEQLTAFFQELGLAIGDAERKAMKARNIPTHGGLGRGSDYRELRLHGHAYRTLFERTFLKLLDYSGTYIDRTTVGYPSRSIDEPCGGRAE